MQQPGPAADRNNQHNRLRWYYATKVSLAEKQEALRKARVVLDPPCQSFSNSTKERECSQGDDQWRKFEPGNEDRIERTASEPGEQGRANRKRQWQVHIPPEHAENNSGQTHHRAD